MIQLKVLYGKKAGTEWVARHFPFSVGRDTRCGLCLDEPGVWDEHFQINLSGTQEFLLSAEAQTFVTIDGKTVQQTVLRNGDVIEMGLARILFGFTPTMQKSLAIREWLTWIGFVALCVSEMLLIYRLPG
ncbi:MAG: FHA domain-containing protein [Verrucomicrobiota bacterium]